MALHKVHGLINTADLVTKHLTQAGVTKHLDSLDMWVESGRAATAPTLSMMQHDAALGHQRPTTTNHDHDHKTTVDGRHHNHETTVDGRDHKLDEWSLDREEARRVHHKPRRELFTPLRVAGAPPAKCLTPARITEGRFVGTGECFRHIDSWTTRATAHADMGRLWTGSTRFLVRTIEEVSTDVIEFDKTYHIGATRGVQDTLRRAPQFGHPYQQLHLCTTTTTTKDRRGSKLGDHIEQAAAQTGLPGAIEQAAAQAGIPGALSRPAFVVVAAAAAERELRILSANILISEFNSGAFYMTGLACSMPAFPSKFEHNNRSRRIRSVATLDSRADRAVGGCALNAPRQGKS